MAAAPAPEAEVMCIALRTWRARTPLRALPMSDAGFRIGDDARLRQAMAAAARRSGASSSTGGATGAGGSPFSGTSSSRGVSSAAPTPAERDALLRQLYAALTAKPEITPRDGGDVQQTPPRPFTASACMPPTPKAGLHQRRHAPHPVFALSRTPQTTAKRPQSAGGSPPAAAYDSLFAGGCAAAAALPTASSAAAYAATTMILNSEPMMPPSPIPAWELPASGADAADWRRQSASGTPLSLLRATSPPQTASPPHTPLTTPPLSAAPAMRIFRATGVDNSPLPETGARVGGADPHPGRAAAARQRHAELLASSSSSAALARRETLLAELARPLGGTILVDGRKNEATAAAAEMATHRANYACAVAEAAAAIARNSSVATPPPASDEWSGLALRLASLEARRRVRQANTATQRLVSILGAWRELARRSAAAHQLLSEELVSYHGMRRGWVRLAALQTHADARRGQGAVYT